MDAVTTSDGDTVYVARSTGERGSRGRFFPVYRSRERDRRYGWFCGNCESVDNAMDPMGRIRCNRCGNLRKPTRWDAAHE